MSKKKKEEKKILKRTDPAPFMGVCGGFAEHYGFDPLPLRLIMLMMLLVGKGPVILMYIMIGYFLMKPHDAEE